MRIEPKARRDKVRSKEGNDVNKAASI